LRIDDAQRIRITLKKPPLPKPGPEEFVIFEVDGFDQLTPEQKTWPVVSLFGKPPKKETETPDEKK
jgi:hypothetical protein